MVDRDQLEQGRTLVEHGQALGAIVVTLESMQETQRSMPGEMRSMQESLGEHGRILARLDPGD